MQLLTTRNSDVQNPLQDLRYTYDPVGNIVEIYDASKETSYYNNTAIEPRHLYTYDALYRLLSGSGRELLGLAQATSGGYAANSIGAADTRALHTYTQHFAYDELGNIQSIHHQTPTSALNWTRNYVYDGVTNRLLKHDDNQTLPDYTYDEHGNMLKMPHLQSMHYDYQDQLNKVVLDASGNTAYYIYDAGGQRVRKVVEKGYVREERIYVGGYEVFRRYENSTLDMERSTVHIMDDKNRVALIEKLKVYEGETVSGSEQIRYQYSNHLGSASLELNATGQIISYEEYHPFGSTSYRSGTNETEVSLKRYKYIGKERDEETGLYYYGARYYAAWIGRFVSVDPMKEGRQWVTPYNYCQNNPVLRLDINGLLDSNYSDDEKNENNSKINNGLKGFNFVNIQKTEGVFGGKNIEYFKITGPADVNNADFEELNRKIQEMRDLSPHFNELLNQLENKNISIAISSGEIDGIGEGLAQYPSEMQGGLIILKKITEYNSKPNIPEFVISEEFFHQSQFLQYGITMEAFVSGTLERKTTEIEGEAKVFNKLVLDEIGIDMSLSPMPPYLADLFYDFISLSRVSSMDNKIIEGSLFGDYQEYMNKFISDLESASKINDFNHVYNSKGINRLNINKPDAFNAIIRGLRNEK